MYIDRSELKADRFAALDSRHRDLVTQALMMARARATENAEMMRKLSLSGGNDFISEDAAEMLWKSHQQTATDFNNLNCYLLGYSEDPDGNERDE